MGDVTSAKLRHENDDDDGEQDEDSWPRDTGHNDDQRRVRFVICDL